MAEPAARQAPQGAREASGRQRQGFQELRKNLDGIASWELSPNSFEKVRMKFTESASAEHAQMMLAVLGK